MSENDKKKYSVSETQRIFYPPIGIWLTAGKDFYLRGGWGSGWRQPDVLIKNGGKFRLVKSGTPVSPAIWEIE